MRGVRRLIPTWYLNAQISEKTALFVWLISHQPAVLFSHNKSTTSNQPAVLFSQIYAYLKFGLRWKFDRRWIIIDLKLQWHFHLKSGRRDQLDTCFSLAAASNWSTMFTFNGGTRDFERGAAKQTLLTSRIILVMLYYQCLTNSKHNKKNA
jgi:hypothetical protein